MSEDQNVTETQAAEVRNRRKERIGYVVSDKMQKTIVVELEDRKSHPLYGKIIRRSKKYHAHDDTNEYREGETVRIEETAPISKLKTWKVIARVDTHKSPEEVAAEAAA